MKRKSRIAKRKCGCKNCPGIGMFKWVPSKHPKNPFWCCTAHYALLTMVYHVAIVRRNKTFTVVKVIPEAA